MNYYIPAHEDRAAFDRLLESYQSDFQPATTHEHFLVGQLAHSRWRLDRAHRLEAVALEQLVSGEIDETNPNSRIASSLGPNALTILNRWAATAENSYHRAHRELTQSRTRTLRNKAKEAQVWIKESFQDFRRNLYQNQPNSQNEANFAPAEAPAPPEQNKPNWQNEADARPRCSNPRP